MKILNLIIQNSKFQVYQEMYEILSPFYKKFKFVDSYFIEYEEQLDCDYLLNGDLLKIKGKESMVPGLLQKTIDALLILKRSGVDYDFLVRSNVSTVVNFGILKDLLHSSVDIDYFGAAVNRINGLDVPYGIVDEKYFGYHFASGTLIGLSNKYVDALLLNRHKLHFDLIDDVAIGVFIKEYLTDEICRFFPENLLVMASNQIHNQDTIEHYHKKNNPVAWRNRGDDRDVDVKNMNTIVEFLKSTI